MKSIDLAADISRKGFCARQARCSGAWSRCLVLFFLKTTNLQTTMNTANTADIPAVKLHTLEADGIKVFYREAGPVDGPVLVLLHGYPTSSHMFRHLIPLLASDFRVIAPDLPGFGFTEVPTERNYRYTFDNLAVTINAFVEALNLTRYGLYVFDCGDQVRQHRRRKARARRWWRLSSGSDADQSVRRYPLLQADQPISHQQPCCHQPGVADRPSQASRPITRGPPRPRSRSTRAVGPKLNARITVTIASMPAAQNLAG
jgi:hypothetical protein